MFAPQENVLCATSKRLAIQSCRREGLGKAPLERWAVRAGAAGRGGCGAARSAGGQGSRAGGKKPR